MQKFQMIAFTKLNFQLRVGIRQLRVGIRQLRVGIRSERTRF
jgi:hypothetical protein